MLQLHLSDKQFYCLHRCILYKRFEGIHVFIFFCLVGPWMTCTSTVVVHPHIWLMCCLGALLPHPSPLLGTGREPRAWVSDLMTSCCFPGPLCGESTRSPIDSAHKNLVIRALIFFVPCFLKESKGTINRLYLSVRLSVTTFGCCNCTTAGPIHSRSMEPSWLIGFWWFAVTNKDIGRALVKLVYLFLLSLNKLLQKQLNFWWFEMPWRWCNMTVVK